MSPDQPQGRRERLERIRQRFLLREDYSPERVRLHYEEHVPYLVADIATLETLLRRALPLLERVDVFPSVADAAVYDLLRDIRGALGD